MGRLMHCGPPDDYAMFTTLRRPGTSMMAYMNDLVLAHCLGTLTSEITVREMLTHLRSPCSSTVVF